jgi:hypothetical protein
MNFYQLRGTTGFMPKRDNMAEIYDRSALLPSIKNAEFNRSATERAQQQSQRQLDQNQAYYDKSLSLQEDAQNAAEKDRNRGLILQGGMAALSGASALNDAVGGDLPGKAVGAIKDVFSPSQPFNPGEIMSPNYAGTSSPSDGWSLSSAASDIGSAAKDYIVDPLAEGIKKAGGYLADAGQGFVDFIFS